MTLPTGNQATRSAKGGQAAAFTLVELLLVLAMLSIVVALAAPTLGRFFRGRTLETEAARFLALTRYGQSRAVSAGTPMVLWVQRAEGTYGLREESRYSPTTVGLAHPIETLPRENRVNEEIPLEYQLAKDLRFEVDGYERLTNNVGTIRFWPDGSIDEESLRLLVLRDQENVAVPISLARNRLKYEIAEPTNQWRSTIR